ncbi:hypothetical protein M885DRAFT_495718 [Pelagophyceae sp. CCMP2097]|nr:hypothetical protein M885DRAFT_495718 [Pelagophyceae sp. CCMP2097]
MRRAAVITLLLIAAAGLVQRHLSKARADAAAERADVLAEHARYAARSRARAQAVSRAEAFQAASRAEATRAASPPRIEPPLRDDDDAGAVPRLHDDDDAAAGERARSLASGAVEEAVEEGQDNMKDAGHDMKDAQDAMKDAREMNEPEAAQDDDDDDASESKDDARGDAKGEAADGDTIDATAAQGDAMEEVHVVRDAEPAQGEVSKAPEAASAPEAAQGDAPHAAEPAAEATAPAVAAEAAAPAAPREAPHGEPLEGHSEPLEPEEPPETNGDKLLHLAAAPGASGDVPGAAQHVSDHGSTYEALAVAAIRLDPAMVRLLSRGGLPPSTAAYAEPATPLHGACVAAAWGDSMRGSLLLELMLGKPSMVDAALRFGGTPEGERLLSHRGAGGSYGAATMRTALAPAVTAVVLALVNAGVPLDSRDATGRTALHSCAQGGWSDAVQVLIDHGASIDPMESIHGMTPLHLASVSGAPESTLRLLEAGADVRLRDSRGHTFRNLVTGRGAALGAVFQSLQKVDQDADWPERAAAFALRARLEDLYGGLGNEGSHEVHVPSTDRGGWRGESPDRLRNAASSGDLGRCDIPVVSAESVEEGEVDLFRDFVSLGRPVLVRGLVDESRWPLAHLRFAKETFLERHGEGTVSASEIPYADKFGSKAGERPTTLRQYVDGYVFEQDAETVAKDKWPWYVFKLHPVSAAPAELEVEWFAETEAMPVPHSIFHAFDNAVRLFTRGNGAPTHGNGAPARGLVDGLKDRLKPFVNFQFGIGKARSGAPVHLHNAAWSALVYGSKRWSFLPPAYAVVSNVHIVAWEADRVAGSREDLELVPLMCVQRAGDVMVVPELWSHGILNLDDTVSVATETHASIFRPRLPLAYGRLQRFASEPGGEA